MDKIGWVPSILTVNWVTQMNQYQLIDGAHRMESLKNLKLANPIRYEHVEKVACRVYNDLTEHESIAVATCNFNFNLKL